MKKDNEKSFIRMPFAGIPCGINQTCYYLNQLPLKWVSKGLRLHEDALKIFKIHKREKDILMDKLKNVLFPITWDQTMIFLHDNYSSVDKAIPEFNSFYLLSHLSLENILKGIYLNDNPNLLGFNKLPKQINTHNTLGLLNKDIKNILTQEEKCFMKKCEREFTSYSRYPVKSYVKEEDLNNIEETFDTGENLYNHFKDLTRGVFDNQGNILESIIEKLMPYIEEVSVNDEKHNVILEKNVRNNNKNKIIR